MARRVLLALVVLGVALRILSLIALWPTTPTLQDGYQTFATNPFMDPQHPAGYGLILGAIGDLTHQVAVPVLLQHLLGIASALLLWAATTRLTGSPWPGLLPAAVVLLDGDQIFLEHVIMSESWAVFVGAAGLYCAVRAYEEPRPWTRWPLITGVALAGAAVIRSAALPMLAVAVLALAGAALASRRRGWSAPLAVTGTAVVILLAFAAANAQFGHGFGIEPSPGWELYGRAAQFADCRQFTPPLGTSGLCESTPPSQRQTALYYMYFAQSPAVRLFHSFGAQDGLVGGWARRAVFAQFGDFLSTAWSYLRGYYVPSSLPARLKSSNGLDPQLSFTFIGNLFFVAAQQTALEHYYGHFTPHRVGWALRILRRWQVIFRFGATALFVATILVLIGLLVGSARSRFGVFLFGVGGLSLIVGPTFTGTYAGRYTVPMAGPLAAAAAITITELYRAARPRMASIRERRRPAR